MTKKCFGEGEIGDAWSALKKAYEVDILVIVTYTDLTCNILCLEVVGVANEFNLPDLSNVKLYEGFMPEGYS